MNDLFELMGKVDKVVYSDHWKPLRGWHGDYKPGEEYLPAIQQERSEFEYLLHDIIRLNLVGTKCLQLGLGDGCSHEVWECIFRGVWTIESDPHKIQNGKHKLTGRILCGDTHFKPESNKDWIGANNGWDCGGDLVDFLFIDAGHLYADVRQDYHDYGPLVRPGGIIAFHDALERPGFPGIEVHKFLSELNPDMINIVGTEVGTAWMVKR